MSARPFVTGFCNPSNPPDSHRRCRPDFRADGVACSCACHARASDPLTGCTDAVAALETALPRLLEACTDSEARDMAEFLLIVREARERLQGIERDLEGETAKAMLGDYAESAEVRVERSRATDRKAWDHESWQRDARKQVLRKHGLAGLSGVLSGDGEVLPPEALHAAISELVSVHGSAAPKTTALKALGIDPRDYCESSPGAWRVRVIRLATEEKGETDAA